MIDRTKLLGIRLVSAAESAAVAAKVSVSEKPQPDIGTGALDAKIGGLSDKPGTGNVESILDAKIGSTEKPGPIDPQ